MNVSGAISSVIITYTYCTAQEYLRLLQGSDDVAEKVQGPDLTSFEFLKTYVNVKQSVSIIIKRKV